MFNAVFVTVALLTLSPTPPPGQVSPSPGLLRAGGRAPAHDATARRTTADAAPARTPAHGAAPAPGAASPHVHAFAPAATTAHVHALVPGAKGTEASEPLPQRLGIADPNALYSVRARKRFAAYLRFRLLELREEHLSRAAEAIEHHISVSTLLQGP